MRPHSAQEGEHTTQVLVIGGSLVGLSSALFLAAHKIPTILVEQRAGSSLHPRAVGYTPRTLELYSAVGLSARIPEVPPTMRLRRARVESLAGKWLDEWAWTPDKKGQTPGGPAQGGPAQGGPAQGGPAQGGPTQGGPPQGGPRPGGPGPGGPGPQGPRIQFSPHTGAAIAQDKLEPILRERAAELGADLRPSTQLLRFTQDSEGVTAYVRDKTDSREYTIRAQYMIACDGHRSQVREALGITRSGRGYLRTLSSVLFRAPLEEYLERGVHQFQIEQPGFEAFLTTYGDGRWVVMGPDAERDEAAQRELVERAIGRTDLQIEIITSGRWELSAWIADKYSEGRVFLAGDAAHTLPPSRGGYGANTGIEDVHNLAWKLAAVLRGESQSGLLDTYDAERRPIGKLRHDQIFSRPDYAAHADKDAPKVVIEDDAMELGQLYRSPAILGAGAELPPAQRPDQWAGQPGTRAAHVWMTKKGANGETEKISSLALFQGSWVLHSENAAWRDAAVQASAKSGIALTFVRVGDDVAPVDPEEFRKYFGIGENGASLVRPDGYIAWRSTQLPADGALCDALKRVAFVKEKETAH